MGGGEFERCGNVAFLHQGDWIIEIAAEIGAGIVNKTNEGRRRAQRNMLSLNVKSFKLIAVKVNGRLLIIPRGSFAYLAANMQIT